ncbi:MAG: heme exporter protein CcmD [Acidimicrobiales bacterium]
MTQAGYVLGGYGVTALAVAGYAWRVMARGRALSRRADQPSDVT